MSPIPRLNRWSLAPLVERDTQHASLAAVARDAQAAPSTLTDLLKGRRDASEELLQRLADTVRVDVRAIHSDPYGVIAPLERVAAAARALAPHLNGHDFGLRDALAELDRTEGT